MVLPSVQNLPLLFATGLLSFLPSPAAALGLGALLGISLAAPPGPILAMMASESTRSWTRGFATGMAAMLADALFFLLMWQGVLRVLQSDTVFGALSLAGALVMVYFAWGAWSSRDEAVVHADPAEAETGVDSTFLGAFLIALTNPFQITWWLTAGLSLLSQLGPLVIVGFFSGITLFVALFATIVRWGTERWRQLPKLVAVLSAVLLAGFAVWSTWNGVTLLA